VILCVQWLSRDQVNHVDRQRGEQTRLSHRFLEPISKGMITLSHLVKSAN
jgi:hypothetical protein